MGFIKTLNIVFIILILVACQKEKLEPYKLLALSDDLVVYQEVKDVMQIEHNPVFCKFQKESGDFVQANEWISICYNQGVFDQEASILAPFDGVLDKDQLYSFEQNYYLLTDAKTYQKLTQRKSWSVYDANDKKVSQAKLKKGLIRSKEGKLKVYLNIKKKPPLATDIKLRLKDNFYYIPKAYNKVKDDKIYACGKKDLYKIKRLDEDLFSFQQSPPEYLYPCDMYD